MNSKEPLPTTFTPAGNVGRSTALRIAAIQRTTGVRIKLRSYSRSWHVVITPGVSAYVLGVVPGAWESEFFGPRFGGLDAVLDAVVAFLAPLMASQGPAPVAGFVRSFFGVEFAS